MSSHHMQSHSDPNYLLRLQNLRIADDSAGNASPSRRTHSLNGSIGSAIEGLAKEPINYNVHSSPSRKVPMDYKLYERNNIITASKLGSSKLNENLMGPQVGVKFPSAGFNRSPTHSLSGSSQHSGSPRTSLIASGLPPSTMQMHDPRLSTQPVYENIDYYAPTSSQSSRVNHDQHGYVQYSGSFDSTHKKAEPQVPNCCNSVSAMGRFAHTPQPPDIIEQTPIYENVLSVTGELVFDSTKVFF